MKNKELPFCSLSSPLAAPVPDPRSTAPVRAVAAAVFATAIDEMNEGEGGMFRRGWPRSAALSRLMISTGCGGKVWFDQA